MPPDPTTEPRKVHRPLDEAEEARYRAYVGAAVREVEVVKGGMFDMAARLFATLDDARGGTTTACPLTGVHEHAFRGPHRFQEWEPVRDPT